MINKIYKLKQQQINQQVLLKQQTLSKMDDIDKEIYQTNVSLNTTTVDIMGAISDFRVLQIHKETMKEHIIKLSKHKEVLKKKLESYDHAILELNKQSEQFNYILQEQKREKLKQIQKQEEIVTSEFVQAKFVKNLRETNVY
ncbi:MAG: hypothetical protein U9R37_00995 [Campylobacterota bacterium]|nr:hypothetical protein [Campylobacterota bacterium]